MAQEKKELNGGTHMGHAWKLKSYSLSMPKYMHNTRNEKQIQIAVFKCARGNKINTVKGGGASMS